MRDERKEGSSPLLRSKKYNEGMHYYEVAPNQIIRAASASFTYSSESPLSLGQIVSIEIGKKKVVGVIVREVSKPAYATKPIQSVIEDQALPAALVELSLWLSAYYATHLATVLQTVLPRGVQKNRRASLGDKRISSRRRTKNVFTREQSLAIDTIRSMSQGSAILHGVTGSGKTAVYIEVAGETIRSGQSVIILVPEISLTSQLVDEFSHHFKHVVLAHSRQTEAERHQSWRSVLRSDSPTVVIGPRSALFLPLRNVGLIVVDEFHEPSFKQEQSPRYSALRAASVLASLHNAKLVLGSATPPIAEYFLAKQANRPIIRMASRAKTGAVAPTIDLVDMTKRHQFTKHRFFSTTLLNKMNESLTSGHQALIFHNRRGSASTTLCENCGWIASCPRCYVPFTLHADTHQLHCHICGQTDRVPTSCPTCHHADVVHKGIGTKLIESELRKLFPNKVIARFDGDTDAKETVDQIYDKLYTGDIDIIVGTQVIAKGLDLPKLRTVGIVQADTGLSLPDFSSPERTFQLLAQAIGRVGRSHHPTTVVVQSYQPAHSAIAYGLSQDYESFYSYALRERKRALFPPFTFLLKLSCIYKTEAAAIKNAQNFARQLRAMNIPDLQILGPTPAFYERQHDTYRWQLVLKSPRRATLVSVLDHLPSAHWQFELDPASLL